MSAYNEVSSLDESMVLMAQEKFNKSKEKSVTKTKQRVPGRLYAGKTSKMIDFQKAAKIVIATIGMGILLHGYNQTGTIIDYNVTADQVARQELDLSSKLDFYDHQDLTDGNIIDKVSENIKILDQIDAKKEELVASGEYEWGNLNSQVHSDAIKAVAEENTLNEIREMNNDLDGGHGYGK